LLDNVTFWSLLVLLVLIAIPYGGAENWWEAFFSCAVFALCLLWIAEAMLSGSWRIADRQLLLPAAALIAYCFFQSIPLWQTNADALGAGNKIWYTVSADPFETRRLAFKLGALILYGLLLLSHCSSPKRLRAVVNVIISLAVASALYGILRQTTQRGTSFLFPFVQGSVGFGQFINQNHFAFLMEMSFGLVSGMIIGGGVGRERKLIYLAALLPLWTSVVMANSRGGLLSMLGQLIFIALMFTSLHKAQTGPASTLSSRALKLAASLPVRILLGLCLAAAMIVGMIWVGGDPVVNKMGEMRQEINAPETGLRQGTKRIEIWRATWQVIKEHPLAGVGLGGYWAVIPKYHDASGTMTPQQAHNDYLELLASLGIIGTMLAVWLVTALLLRVRRPLGSKDPFRRAVCFGALVGLLGVALHSIADFGLHITANAVVCATLLVLATVNGRTERADSRQ
jgi:O-antigen ligase